MKVELKGTVTTDGTSFDNFFLILLGFQVVNNNMGANFEKSIKVCYNVMLTYNCF